jgi:ceramide synthetase
MHIYWTIYQLKTGKAIFKAGRYRNLYDNKENKIEELQK